MDKQTIICPAATAARGDVGCRSILMGVWGDSSQPGSEETSTLGGMQTVEVQ